MLIRAMLSEALSDPPTLIDGGGKDYDKSENPVLSIDQCHVLFSTSAVYHAWDSCNKLHRCAKYFFMIVGMVIFYRKGLVLIVF